MDYYVLREASPNYIPLSIVTSRHDLLLALHYYYKESGSGFLINIFRDGELAETCDQSDDIPPLNSNNLLCTGEFVRLQGTLYEYIEGEYELTEAIEHQTHSPP